MVDKQKAVCSEMGWEPIFEHQKFLYEGKKR